MPAMNDRARSALRDLIAERGSELAGQPERLAGFLRDDCGDCKAEIHVLVEAAKDHIPIDLTAAQGEPIELVLRRLAQRLSNERGTDPEAARWALDSWAIALGRLEPQGADHAGALPPQPPDSKAQRTDSAPPQSASLLRQASAAVRTPEGKPRWGIIGAIVLVGMAVFGQFSNNGGGEIVPSSGGDSTARRDSGPRITGVRHLREFPADNRKAWFYVQHTGPIDRVQVDFLEGSWKPMSLTPEQVAGGNRFTFWLSETRTMRGRARLTAFAGADIAGPPYTIEFAAVGANDAAVTATSRLRITDVRYRRQAPADGSNQTFEVLFDQDNGERIELELVVLRGRLEHQIFGYEPSSNRNGKIDFRVSTNKPDNVLLRVRLVDAQGNRSNPYSIPFDILPVRPSSGATPRR